MIGPFLNSLGCPKALEKTETHYKTCIIYLLLREQTILSSYLCIKLCNAFKVIEMFKHKIRLKLSSLVSKLISNQHRTLTERYYNVLLPF